MKQLGRVEVLKKLFYYFKDRSEREPLMTTQDPQQPK